MYIDTQSNRADKLNGGYVGTISRLRPVTGELQDLDLCENVSVIWAPRADLTKFVPATLIYPPVLHALEKEPSQ
ncbi:hypothetical protein ACWEPC_02035 [Nonomuraea sp. NPDC004297]